MNPILALISLFVATYVVATVVNFLWFIRCCWLDDDDNCVTNFELAIGIFCPFINLVIFTKLMIAFVKWTLNRETT